MNSRSFDKEIAGVRKIAGSFLRHPRQINKMFEADAEIIDFGNQSHDYLVFKSDGIHEEIKEKLYNDPYLIGWMAVTVTVSDLAAVGSDPLGMLLSLQLPQDYSDNWMRKFQQGINDACALYRIRILGGDTNFDETVSVNTTGIATIAQTKPLFRKHIVPGDLIYASGKLGIGNAFAYSRFFDPSIKIDYKPVARLNESKDIASYATACIDTSDGLFPALSVLADLNHIGIKLSEPLSDFLNPQIATVYETSGIPAWIFLAGPHGEYELIFSIPSQNRENFEMASFEWDWKPVFLGEIIADQCIRFTTEQTEVTCGPSEIANLFREAKGNIPRYFQMLMARQEQWSINKSSLL